MVRTRFAPSPTGYLHIGGIRTALFNWLLARQSGGQFVLRIDDTDAERNVHEALQPILDGFQWLGLDWDEGPQVGGPHEPYFQSQRAALYQHAVAQLLASGHAYRDFARAEELQQRDVAQAAGQRFIYDRRFMAESDQQSEQFESEGRSSVVRLKMPREGTCSFQDLIRGDVSFEWSDEQDHVIQRADGSCLYHLATVVDDHDYQISHVIRAAEHLSNTPRQIFIAQSLKFPIPQFGHLPYVAEPGGHKKLSKRDLSRYLKNREFAKLMEHGVHIVEGCDPDLDRETFNPVIVDFYREIGFLPDAVLNYLLLLGWSLDDKTEFFTRPEMIQQFSLARVNKAPASFDPQKMLAFQATWMAQQELDTKVDLVLPFLKQAGWYSSSDEAALRDRTRQVVSAVGDRLRVAGDILDYRYCFVGDMEFPYDRKHYEKRIAKPVDAQELLEELARVFAQLESFDEVATETAMKAFVQSKGIKIGQIIHALRVAITGQSVGFGMFETLAILGKQSVLRRIERALELSPGGSAE